MKSLLAKLFEYTNLFIIKDKWVRRRIFFIICFVILANYIEIKCSRIAASIGIKIANIKSDIISFCLLLIIMEIFNYIVSIFIAYFIANSIKNAFQAFFIEYLSLKPVDFSKTSVGDIHYDIQRRSLALSDFFTVLTISFISNLVFFLFVCYELLINLQIFAAAKILFFLIIFMSISIYSQKLKTNLRTKVNIGFQNNSRKIYDILLNYERVLAYDNKNIELEKYKKIVKEQEWYGKLFWSSLEVMYAINNIVFAAITVIIINEFNKYQNVETIEISQLIAIINALHPKISELTYSIDQVCIHFTNMDQSEIKSFNPENTTDNFSLVSFEEKIEITNLSFLGRKQIFSNMNLIINKKEKIAVVGASGTGKSIFLKILLGNYDNYSGNIKIDGIDYEKTNKKSLRRIFAYIPQTPLLLDTTVIDNIRMGNFNISDEKLVMKCKEFGYHNTFKEIGYTKRTGTHGNNLSGGQKQKISFMRAVIKEVNFFIMDEPTSSMDSKSILEVFNFFNTILSQSTTVVVLNNLNLLNYFDSIIFFDKKNNFIEKSNFDDLMKKNNTFKEYYSDFMKNSSENMNILNNK